MSIDLLREYEPVLRFTHGELFFPCAIDSYLTQCSLWSRKPDGKTFLIRPEGMLTEDVLVQASQEHITGQTLYLRYVNSPLEGNAYQKWRRGNLRPQFNAKGRLARVGLLSRIVDSGFDISLLVRGRVPGGTTAAAHLKYLALRAKDPRFVYYGRVIREGGYIILHYLYFSVMNNWRSTFYGVNDHEGDWEQVFIYLSDEGTFRSPIPQWIAYAAHDEYGDDLRRRWDDPSLTIIDGKHPVVYVGAGSHASYFEQGEYLTKVTLPALATVRTGVQQVRLFWNEKLRQGAEDPEVIRREVENLFSIPFVDYARGDGISIGPGTDHPWTPVLIDDDVPWVDEYRGLWGLDTRDLFGGERAPAGPKYNRNGTVRASWNNPLGWSGLHKVPPPREAEKQLKSHIKDLEIRYKVTVDQIELRRDELRLIGLEVRALTHSDQLTSLQDERLRQLYETETALNSLYTQLAQLDDSISAAGAYLHDLEKGERGDPRAHIKHELKPEPASEKESRLVEFWAALSTGLFIVLVAFSLVFAPGDWFQRVFLIVAAFVVIESTLRGQIVTIVTALVITLALITTMVLIVQFSSIIAMVILLGLAQLIITSNLREFTDR